MKFIVRQNFKVLLLLLIINKNLNTLKFYNKIACYYIEDLENMIIL